MRLLLFFLFPALELYLLVVVGGIVGALNMVLWVFASAFIGLWAARVQGQAATFKVRAELAAGRVPEQDFMDGLLLFFAGVLLILPGLITDAVGLLLFVPWFRRFAAGVASRYFASRQGQTRSSSIFFVHGCGSGGARSGFGARGQAENSSGAGDVFDAEVCEPRQAVVLESRPAEKTTVNKGDADNAAGTQETSAPRE